MNLTITTRHALPARGTAEYVSWISEKLARFFRRVLTIEWILQTDGLRRIATCRVHAQSGFYRAQVAAESFRQAIHDTGEALARQRRRRKAVRHRVRSHHVSKFNRWRGDEPSPGGALKSSSRRALSGGSFVTPAML